MILIPLHHERQVHVLEAVSYVDVTMLGGYRHVEEGQTKPQQTSDYANPAAMLKLQTPRSCAQNIVNECQCCFRIRSNFTKALLLDQNRNTDVAVE